MNSKHWLPFVWPVSAQNTGQKKVPGVLACILIRKNSTFFKKLMSNKKFYVFFNMLQRII